METVILCGGFGTRMKGFGEVPKPMVPVGHQPLLWHLMDYYRSYGYSRFHLCGGFRIEVISRYLTENPDPDITLWNTGIEASTLNRVWQIRDKIGDDEFFLTYGDGISDVDLHALLRFHRSHGKMMTVVGIRRNNRFGILHCANSDVINFTEKPELPKDQYINGGFFVCNKSIFDFIPTDPQGSIETMLLPSLCASGMLQMYYHKGYWQCMDDYQDWLMLEESYAKGGRQWIHTS